MSCVHSQNVSEEEMKSSTMKCCMIWSIPLLSVVLQAYRYVLRDITWLAISSLSNHWKSRKRSAFFFLLASPGSTSVRLSQNPFLCVHGLFSLEKGWVCPFQNHTSANYQVALFSLQLLPPLLRPPKETSLSCYRGLIPAGLIVPCGALLLR